MSSVRARNRETRIYSREDAEDEYGPLGEASSPSKNNSRTKGNWSYEEDVLLIKLVNEQGEGNWSSISRHFPGRIGKQCRERWHNQLRPDIKRDAWQPEEEELLIDAHRRLGNKWADIAKHIPGRTENSVKNHWNATLRRKEGGHVDDQPLSLLKRYLNSLSLGSGRKAGKKKSVRYGLSTKRAPSSCENINKSSNSQQQRPKPAVTSTKAGPLAIARPGIGGTSLGAPLPFAQHMISSQKQPATPEADGFLDWLTNTNINTSNAMLTARQASGSGLGGRDAFRTPDPLLLASPLLSPRTAPTMEINAAFGKSGSFSLFADTSPDFLGVRHESEDMYRRHRKRRTASDY